MVDVADAGDVGCCCCCSSLLLVVVFAVLEYCDEEEVFHGRAAASAVRGL